MNEPRKCEIFVDDVWKEIKFEELKKGDKFRLFEPTGEPVADDKGGLEFITAGDAYVTTAWTVDIED